MRAGRLRHRVTIEEASESRDGLGASILSWSTLATVWGEVRMAPAGERVVSGADVEVAQVTHRVKIRYRDDVGPLNRLLHDSKILDIESAVDPDGRGRELVLLCREEVGETA